MTSCDAVLIRFLRKVHLFAGDVYRFEANSAIDLTPFWLSVHKHWLQIAVATGDNAHLLLCKYPDDTSKDVIEVVFGATTTYIRENRCALEKRFY